jgi:hypothetical protein
MTTKHNLIVIAASILIAVAVPVLYKAGKGNEINYRTFHQSAGWGYDIVVKGKLFIHQEYIPAIAQKKGFPAEPQARKAAQLIIYKLKNNKLPTLSLADVEQICKTGDSMTMQQVAHE